MGMADLAYDFSDMEMLGESCHRDIESWPGLKRKLWFKMRSEGKSFMAFLKEWANR